MHPAHNWDQISWFKNDNKPTCDRGSTIIDENIWVVYNIENFFHYGFKNLKDEFKIFSCFAASETE